MKRKFGYPILLAGILCGTFAFGAGCAYSSKYALEECSVTVGEANNSGNRVEHGKRFSGADFEIYFGKGFDHEEVIDEWIDRATKLNALLNQKGLDGVRTVYVGESVTANCWSENGEKSYSFRPEISEEETLAWALYFQAEGELPFGVYAGVAANWLEKAEFSHFLYSSLTEKDYLTELQFPLYETDNLPEKERAYAWSFSYALVNDWVKSGNPESKLLALGEEEFSVYLRERYGLELPEYTFFPYSSKYEYKVEQGGLTYYINKEYRDMVLPDDRFSTSYDLLSDWLKDNQKTIEHSNAVFQVADSYAIDVYLDDGLSSSGTMGDLQTAAGRSNILLNSVGVFPNYYIYYIFEQNGEKGYLRDAMTDLHANDSEYANATYYYLYSGKAENYPYVKNDVIDEKKFYGEAMDFYNQVSLKKASAGDFNFWLFADCFSALYTKKDENFISRLQQHSELAYIRGTYGESYLSQMNKSGTSVTFEGKSYSEVKGEWIEYLGNAIKSE